jgi:hypothetical protein
VSSIYLRIMSLSCHPNPRPAVASSVVTHVYVIFNSMDPCWSRSRDRGIPNSITTLAVDGGAAYLHHICWYICQCMHVYYFPSERNVLTIYIWLASTIRYDYAVLTLTDYPWFACVSLFCMHSRFRIGLDDASGDVCLFDVNLHCVHPLWRRCLVVLLDFLVSSTKVKPCLLAHLEQLQKLKQRTIDGSTN